MTAGSHEGEGGFSQERLREGKEEVRVINTNFLVYVIFSRKLMPRGFGHPNKSGRVRSVVWWSEKDLAGSVDLR